jgi:MFS transporter, AAHS family, 4-hydroxybenzoate transporter
MNEAINTVDVSQIINRRGLSSLQIRVVALLFLVAMVDGFDVNAAAYAAPALVKEWHLTFAELGPLFAAGLFAGFLGNPLFGYFGDQYGRRGLIVGGMIFFGAFTLASVWSTSLMPLIYLRFLAGIGIAGVLVIAVALNNEFAAKRMRATMTVVLMMGVTFGGTFPGLVSANLIAVDGWRVLFWIGGLFPIALAIVLLFLLPESPKFLSLRPNRRSELAALLQEIDPSAIVSPGTVFVIGEEVNQQKLAPKDLAAGVFEGALSFITPLFWITNFIGLGMFFFLNQWMPTLLHNDGVSIESAAVATVMFQLGSTISGLAIMRPMDKYGFIPVPVLYALGIPVIAEIGLAGWSYTTLMVLMFAAGFCLSGVQSGNIAGHSQIYPTYIRSWGIGLCHAMSRLGGVIFPLLVGLLLSAHVSVSHLFVYATIPMAFGLIDSLILTPLYRKRVFRVPQTPISAATEALSNS